MIVKEYVHGKALDQIMGNYANAINLFAQAGKIYSFWHFLEHIFTIFEGKWLYPYLYYTFLVLCILFPIR